MSKQLLQQSEYCTITNNQTRIIEQLDKTNLLLTNTNELSNKFVGEAIHNFKKGTQAIARIRSNLDQIHKALSIVHKARSASKKH